MEEKMKYWGSWRPPFEDRTDFWMNALMLNIASEELPCSFIVHSLSELSLQSGGETDWTVNVLVQCGSGYFFHA